MTPDDLGNEIPLKNSPLNGDYTHTTRTDMTSESDNPWTNLINSLGCIYTHDHTQQILSS